MKKSNFEGKECRVGDLDHASNMIRKGMPFGKGCNYEVQFGLVADAIPMSMLMQLV